MKRLKIFLVSLFSLVLLVATNQRVVIIALTSANLVALVSHAAAYGGSTTTPTATPEQQAANAVSGVVNPSFSLSDSLGGVISGMGMSGLTRGKGLQFKNPMLSSGVAYRSMDDTSVGGFGDNEYTGELGVDADIYDGLLAGLIYAHTYRSGYNSLGTSENMDVNAVSLYSAKRFFDLMNVGLAYNFAATDHKLTRATNMNLDRNSNGFTAFTGISKKKGRWGGFATGSFGYVYDDYDQQNNLETGRFTMSGGLNCDITKVFTLGTVFNYHYFVFQDVLPGGTVRDNDYWTIGPRLQFFPTDNLTINIDFDSQEGFKDYKAYTVRLGVDVAF
jgi:hypothetical protein